VDSLQRRATGSYFTSLDTAQFMTDWLVTEKHREILEPTAGDGVFVDCLRTSAKVKNVDLQITAVEIEKEAFDFLKKRKGINAVRADFHEFKSPPVDAVIGNPPFVRFRHLSKKGLKSAESAGRAVIGKELDTSGSIWLSIILHSINSIKLNGRIAFVIPADALYVRYARPFWNYLCSHFGRVKVIRCRERLFPDILQDVVLLFADSSGKSTTSIECEDFDSFDSLITNKSTAKNVISIQEILSGNKPFMKVSLTPSDREWLVHVHSQCQRALELVKFNIGYVSGNKSYFHPSKDVIQKYRLPKRSLHNAVVTARKLSNSSYLTSQLTSGIEQVWIPNPSKLTMGELAYIKHGEDSGFNAGNKTSGRKPWYLVPGIVVPDVMLTVFGDLPRLLINDARLPASNSILIGRFKKAFPAQEFLLLWYTSITRLGIELSVHSLGGGVLVLVPREGDSIMMPKPINRKIPQKLFERLLHHLKSNDYSSAYEVGDSYLISGGWDPEDLYRARKLSIEFMHRRKKD